MGLQVYQFLSVKAKPVFLQLNCCKNLYHQSQRENIKITVNIKVIKYHKFPYHTSIIHTEHCTELKSSEVIHKSKITATTTIFNIFLLADSKRPHMST